jgi:hypothetical protein
MTLRKSHEKIEKDVKRTVIPAKAGFSTAKLVIQFSSQSAGITGSPPSRG